jgi:hypothetical protein
MPAPQAPMMQQLARAKFTSFNLRVPAGWQAPTGEAARQYADAHRSEDHASQPGSPPLFQPASLNKHHTNAQKMMIATFGGFIDGMCSAICSAWASWQSLASFTGFVVSGPIVTVGQLTGPPMHPMIAANAPKASPQQAKFSNIIASAISSGWLTFQATIKSPGLPFYPAYVAVPTPVAPPTPNVPHPIGTFIQVPASISTAALKAQMVTQLGDPHAPYAPQLFESIASAFETCYNTWKGSTMVTNVMAVATGGTPVTPTPAAGSATMPPGGLV